MPSLIHWKPLLSQPLHKAAIDNAIPRMSSIYARDRT